MEVLGWIIVGGMVLVTGAIIVFGLRRSRAIDDAPVASLMRPQPRPRDADDAIAAIARSNAFRPPLLEPVPDPAGPPASPFARGFIDLSVTEAVARARRELDRLAGLGAPDGARRAESGTARDWALVRLVTGGPASIVESAAVLSDLAAAGCVAFEEGVVVMGDGEPVDALQRAALGRLAERRSPSGSIRLGDCLRVVPRMWPARSADAAGEVADVWGLLQTAFETGVRLDRRTAILIRLLHVEALLQTDQRSVRRLGRRVDSPLGGRGLDERQAQVTRLLDHELPERLAAPLWEQ